jgi:LmbE family N-acetylglucosaminyl deacetylase
MYKFIKSGAKVYSIHFTMPESCVTTREGFAPHSTDHERVLKYLGVSNGIDVPKYEDKHLAENAQDIRDALWGLKKEINPDLVICPARNDMHQDHKVISEACLTIFRDTATILGCEVLRSAGPDFHANYFIKLTDDEAQKKIDALSRYYFQVAVRPHFFFKKAFEAQMLVRGIQCGCKHAEGFELIWGNE